MKVGTDGVLLGAWVNVARDHQILDLGSGTGLIALMCAQRNAKCKVSGIEIDEPAAKQGETNFDNSKWGNRLTMYYGDAAQWATTQTELFDHIITNPPFFDTSGTYKELPRARARARTFLKPEMIFDISNKVGVRAHRISIVFPSIDLNMWMNCARSAGYHPHRKCLVRPTPNKPVHRVLVEFGHDRVSVEENELVLELSRHEFAPEYKQLTSSFYLKG